MSVFAGPADWWTDGTNAGRTHIATKGIVQSGLILNLDAGVSSSYPGSGTTWTDLSGNGNNGTLTNGPTFSGANGGSLVFDGTNDYVSESNFSSLITGSFTLIVAVKFLNGQLPLYQKIFHTQTTTPEINLDNYNGGSGNNKLHFYTAATSSTNNIMTTNEDIINNTWYIMSGVYDDSSFFKYLYVNGVLKNSGSTSVKISWPNSVFRLGRRLSDLEPLNGNIAFFQIYNRALSAAEVQQNFNALRGRFGI